MTIGTAWSEVTGAIGPQPPVVPDRSPRGDRLSFQGDFQSQMMLSSSPRASWTFARAENSRQPGDSADTNSDESKVVRELDRSRK